MTVQLLEDPWNKVEARIPMSILRCSKADECAGQRPALSVSPSTAPHPQTRGPVGSEADGLP